MVDLGNPGPGGTSVSADDFEFRAGNSTDPSTWAAAPAPIGVEQLTGPFGTRRVVIRWADGAIKNKWLRVKVLANADTGLAAADVFYFGNLVGDAGVSPGRVLADDMLEARLALATPAGITTWCDFDRDGDQDASDYVAARNNLYNTLVLLAAP